MALRLDLPAEGTIAWHQLLAGYRLSEAGVQWSRDTGGSDGFMRCCAVCYHPPQRSQSLVSVRFLTVAVRCWPDVSRTHHEAAPHLCGRDGVIIAEL
jgi:hypothetical protein